MSSLNNTTIAAMTIAAAVLGLLIGPWLLGTTGERFLAAVVLAAPLYFALHWLKDR